MVVSFHFVSYSSLRCLLCSYALRCTLDYTRSHIFLHFHRDNSSSLIISITVFTSLCIELTSLLQHLNIDGINRTIYLRIDSISPWETQFRSQLSKSISRIVECATVLVLCNKLKIDTSIFRTVFSAKLDREWVLLLLTFKNVHWTLWWIILYKIWSSEIYRVVLLGQFYESLKRLN